MRETVLVRHAAAAGQEPEAPLTTEGRHGASILARVLEPLGVERVICSPMLRAIQTVEPFCELTKLPMEVDAALVERVLSTRSLPDWREHLQRSFQDLDYCLEDGESGRAAQQRGMSVLGAAMGSGQRCLLVTHGNLLALILKSIEAQVGYQEWSQLSNPDVFVIRRDERGVMKFKRAWPACELPSR
jgi:2,3-bisphosphoglycerate-dependent phosphoglycerate mutase